MHLCLYTSYFCYQKIRVTVFFSEYFIDQFSESSHSLKVELFFIWWEFSGL